jgi:hypothetical protein
MPRVIIVVIIMPRKSAIIITMPRVMCPATFRIYDTLHRL